MSKWHNETGRPLSSFSWLTTHHKAKLNERTDFIKSILKESPRSIIDLGCGPGLWLEILHQIAPPSCALIGIDSDINAIEKAKEKSKNWNRSVSFIRCDIENEIDKIPEADTILAFNIFSYLKEPLIFLNQLKEKVRPKGKVILRQYDGGTLRFGPLNEKLRHLVDDSLYSSIGGSNEFHHYDLDRVYNIICLSKFDSKKLEFELFQRTYPYSKEFQEYYENTIEWTLNYISEFAKEKLLHWYKHDFPRNSYFVEVDLVAVLS